MKKISCVLAAAAILLSALLLIGLSRDGASAQPKASASSIGRYQVFRSATRGWDSDCLFEPATGKVWYLKANTVGDQSKGGVWTLIVEAPK